MKDHQPSLIPSPLSFSPSPPSTLIYHKEGVSSTLTQRENPAQGFHYSAKYVIRIFIGVGSMKNISLEAIYRKVVDLQRDVAEIKKSLMEDPELRDDFILRMKDIDLEESIIVEDFGKRYGLK